MYDAWNKYFKFQFQFSFLYLCVIFVYMIFLHSCVHVKLNKCILLSFSYFIIQIIASGLGLHRCPLPPVSFVYYKVAGKPNSRWLTYLYLVSLPCPPRANMADAVIKSLWCPTLPCHPSTGRHRQLLHATNNTRTNIPLSNYTSNYS